MEKAHPHSSPLPPLARARRPLTPAAARLASGAQGRSAPAAPRPLPRPPCTPPRQGRAPGVRLPAARAAAYMRAGGAALVRWGALSLHPRPFGTTSGGCSVCGASRAPCSLLCGPTLPACLRLGLSGGPTSGPREVCPFAAGSAPRAETPSRAHPFPRSEPCSRSRNPSLPLRRERG